MSIWGIDGNQDNHDNQGIVRIQDKRRFIMAKSLPFKSTPYSNYLWDAIVKMTGQGVTFNAKEIADGAGLKLTGNLRRRLHRWVETGGLYTFQCYRDHDGHVETRFGRWETKPETQFEIGGMQDIPF